MTVFLCHTEFIVLRYDCIVCKGSCKHMPTCDIVVINVLLSPE